MFAMTIAGENRRSSGNSQSSTFLWYDTDRTENVSNKSSIVTCVFIAAVKFFTEPLSSNSRGIHIQTHRL
jgi:hypothetical protein